MRPEVQQLEYPEDWYEVAEGVKEQLTRSEVMDRLDELLELEHALNPKE